jgi:hypothetical protein
MEHNLPLIACSLDSEGQKERLADWASVLEGAAERQATPDGVRYSFDASSDLETRLRALAEAEHGCCSFLDFEFRRVDGLFEMTVTTRADALEALRFIFQA